MNTAQRSTIEALWSVELGQSPAGSPLVVGDLLVVPTQEPGPSAHRTTLHALSLTYGSARWQKVFEYALITGLAATHTPTPLDSHTPPLLLVATTSTDLLRGEGALVALDAAGEERWRWAPGVQRVSAPALVRSNDFSRSGEEATEVATTNLGRDQVEAVCVTADAQTFVVLDLATGEERIRVGLAAGASLSAPAVAGDVAYVPCRGPHLLAVGLDGEARWHFAAGGGSGVWLDRTPAVVGAQLFAVLSTGAALALRIADGSQVWRVDVGPAGKSLSVPTTDGERLFVGTRDGLHALDLADGQEVWAFATSRRVTAAPVVAGGVVYAACHDHHVYALNAASGKELWQYGSERRIEVPAALASCCEPPVPCVLVTDRGGSVAAVARPLSAAEHETAGNWLQAASAYANLGQPARGAALLEAHGEPSQAARLWEAAGERARAAVQYEVAGLWLEAARQWADLGRPLKQAEALANHAWLLEDEPRSDEEKAQAWEAALHVYEAAGERQRTADCRQKVARWRKQPIISLDVRLDKGLVMGAWSRLRFIVRNEGFGPAHNLIIHHATGDQFEGQVTATRQIKTLRAGQERIDLLDVRPRAHGDSVPLRVQVDYQDHAGEPRFCEQTVYTPVAHSEAARRAGATISAYVSSEDAETDRQQELASLRHQLGEARENLRLIEERKTRYVLEVDIPLQLIKEERRLRERIAELERQLGQ